MFVHFFVIVLHFAFALRSTSHSFGLISFHFHKSAIPMAWRLCAIADIATNSTGILNCLIHSMILVNLTLAHSLQHPELIVMRLFQMEHWLSMANARLFGLKVEMNPHLHFSLLILFLCVLCACVCVGIVIPNPIEDQLKIYIHHTNINCCFCIV